MRVEIATSRAELIAAAPWTSVESAAMRCVVPLAASYRNACALDTESRYEPTTSPDWLIEVGERSATPSTPGTSVIEYMRGRESVEGSNRAETCSSLVIVKVQDVVPLHAPAQPAKYDPAAATAVNVTMLPSAKVSQQLAPQSMPAGSEVTRPPPVPVSVTWSACCCGGMRTKVAKTCVSDDMTTLHRVAPVHAPPQLSKRQPGAGCTAKETEMPPPNAATQVRPQSMPAGLETTLPWPLTATLRPNLPAFGVPPSVEGDPAGDPAVPEPPPAALPQPNKRAQTNANARMCPPTAKTCGSGGLFARRRQAGEQRVALFDASLA